MKATSMPCLITSIITDFRRFRIEQSDDSVGAMIVCKTNPQARELYRLWQERFHQAEKVSLHQEEQMLMAAEPMLTPHGYKPLTASLILHDEGDKMERKEYIDGFKKLMDVDVLIVNKMLLTGFDAPRLKKLYLGRSLDGHDLLQALTRVNRPYKDFRYGYVVDFVDIKENFEATNDRYLRELNRTSDEETPEEQPIGKVLQVDKDEMMEIIQHVKSLLFNFTTDNLEEFRKEIDEIENKDSLYELRNTLAEAKAMINQVRSFGDDETREKLKKLPLGAIPTLMTEVTHRIERINLLENTEHKADVSGIINVALSELEFEFKKGLPEELRIIVNDIKERCERVQAEFEANFDQKEERYVILADEFREYFRKKGFVPQSTSDAKEKKKYKGDERFVRIHKRLEEANQHREKPIISQHEYEIAENLARMKSEIDQMLFLNINILNNEEAFKRDILAIIGKELIGMDIKADLQDRKYINNLITSEYLGQYHYA